MQKQTMADGKTSQDKLQSMFSIFKKQFKRCNCKRCLSQVRFAEKWIMPDEDIKWTCSNCSSDFRIFCEPSEQGNLKVTIVQEQYGSFRKLIVENQNNENKYEIIQEVY